MLVANIQDTDKIRNDMSEHTKSLTQRVHVPNNWVLRIWVIVITVQVLGKYMIIRYSDP